MSLYPQPTLHNGSLNTTFNPSDFNSSSKLNTTNVSGTLTVAGLGTFNGGIQANGTGISATNITATGTTAITGATTITGLITANGGLTLGGSNNITLGNGSVLPATAAQLGYMNNIASSGATATFTSGTNNIYGTFTNLPAGTYILSATGTFTGSSTVLTTTTGFITAGGTTIGATTIGNSSNTVATSGNNTINVSAVYQATTSTTYQFGIYLVYTGGNPTASSTSFNFRAIRVA